jgi:hypothetical protein
MSQPTYLAGKPKGDHSMSEKRGTGEAFKPKYAPQGSHAMVKAASLKPSSQGKSPIPLAERLMTTPSTTVSLLAWESNA